ncbi:hypothetical protein [Sulfitobacter sp. S190]|uniref:hypothetical protein n=1 Tax=Sulfitobacter sp. S190 TaxID=2867022 RepID=UPI0021A3D359|nr:hypothetical protein [Sulfitobacter sp. S190]UWR21060.1 hypothetical protein K3756_10030 [Sulfitobacter sp. S190]
MTATADFAQPDVPNLALVRTVDGSRMLIRILQRVFAVALVITTVGLWMAPGASWEPDMMLFKLSLSAIAALAGIGLWQNSLSPLAPTVEIDAAASELRLVREQSNGGRRLIERHSFAALEKVQQDGRQLAFFAADGRMLAEIMLSNAAAHAKLIGALRGVGKLA